MSSPENIQFSDEIPSVRAEAAKLKSQGVQIIILLSHSGYGVDLVIADQIPDLDIIVGSHSHSFLYTGNCKLYWHSVHQKGYIDLKLARNKLF
jgi:2',3'-cyclic-nucleotide 2'-phosphodiesterase (5'-nucleotidase family)